MKSGNIGERGEPDQTGWTKDHQIQKKGDEERIRNFGGKWLEQNLTNPDGDGSPTEET